MDRYAVLGQPIAHSLSPRIHGAFADEAGVRISYERIEVAPEVLADTLATLHAQGYAGLNVTLPHKLAALAACAGKSPRAELAGAANTLTRMAGGWHADNTDGDGLVRDLRVNLDWALKGKRVLLLGSGGAARGVLKPLLDEQPAELVISSRTPWTVEKLATEFKPHGAIRACTHVSLKGDRFDVVINAMSVGHQGRMPRLAWNLLNPGAACYDLNWGKAYVPFRDWARSEGAGTVSDGLGMLVEQAAAAFAHWHGRRPATRRVIDALRAET